MLSPNKTGLDQGLAARPSFPGCSSTRPSDATALAIYVNAHNNWHRLGRGTQYFDELIAHAIRDRSVYKHAWQQHEVCMSANRCTMRTAEPNDNTTLR